MFKYTIQNIDHPFSDVLSRLTFLSPEFILLRETFFYYKLRRRAPCNIRASDVRQRVAFVARVFPVHLTYALYNEYRREFRGEERQGLPRP